MGLVDMITAAAGSDGNKVQEQEEPKGLAALISEAASKHPTPTQATTTPLGTDKGNPPPVVNPPTKTKKPTAKPDESDEGIEGETNGKDGVKQPKNTSKPGIGPESRATQNFKEDNSLLSRLRASLDPEQRLAAQLAEGCKTHGEKKEKDCPDCEKDEKYEGVWAHTKKALGESFEVMEIDENSVLVTTEKGKAVIAFAEDKVAVLTGPEDAAKIVDEAIKVANAVFEGRQLDEYGLSRKGQQAVEKAAKAAFREVKKIFPKAQASVEMDLHHGIEMALNDAADELNEERQVTEAETSSKTKSAISTLSKEDFKGKDDFFKMTQLFTGIAGAAKKGDALAAKFLSQLSDDVTRTAAKVMGKNEDAQMEAVVESIMGEIVTSELLQECSMAYPSNSETDVKERMRSAIRQLCYAVEDFVTEDIGDDGRVFDHAAANEAGVGIYSTIRSIVMKEINVNKLIAAGTKAKGELNKFLK